MDQLSENQTYPLMINNIDEKVERYFMRKTKVVIWKPSMLLIDFF
jgi:hypothetical protein